PDAEGLCALVAGQPDGPARRNALRVALELAARRLTPEAARGLLHRWSVDGEAGQDEGLRAALGRQLLRLALQTRDPAALAEAQRHLPNDPVAAVGRAILAHPADQSFQPPNSPFLTLHQAARSLAAGTVEDSWRERIRGVRQDRTLRPLAQALLLVEAARRRDVDAVAALLNELDAWRGFRS